MKALIYLAIGAFVGWHAHRVKTAVAQTFSDTDEVVTRPAPQLPQIATRITRPLPQPTLPEKIEVLTPSPKMLISPEFAIPRW